jgi:nucleotide-binding universal stress UspA family protein
MKDQAILICYDGSDGARRSIHAARELLGPRRAIVLDVAPVLTAAESFAVMGSAIAGADFEQLNGRGALERAVEGAGLARAAGFIAEPRSEVAAPTWEGILDVADDVDAAVIVIGSHGLNGIRERFEGSVSHQVAERSGRPVLIVPPPRERG